MVTIWKDCGLFLACGILKAARVGILVFVRKYEWL
jgi:hypothetical protein